MPSRNWSDSERSWVLDQSTTRCRFSPSPPRLGSRESQRSLVNSGASGEMPFVASQAYEVELKVPGRSRLRSATSSDPGGISWPIHVAVAGSTAGSVSPASESRS